MATPVLSPSAFTTGEVSPGLFGNVSLTRMHAAAATMRNFFVRYSGGAYSRAGTALVGISKQTGRNYPPRMVPFQFSVNQGLALEFGNFYMRVVLDGAMVTEAPLTLTAASATNPVSISVANASGATSAIANIGGVAASYAAGDTVTLAGGTFSTAAVILISDTTIASLSVNARGSGYAPGDTITLGGGTPLHAGLMQVVTTRLKSATLVSGGSQLVNGAQVATGTTGSGTKFTVNVTVAGNSVTSVNSIASAGSYSANPSNLSAEPVGGIPSTGPGGSLPILSIVMEIDVVLISSRGVYAANSATFTQAATSGSGTGVTFNSVVFGPNTISIATAGSYTVLPSNPVSQASTTGSGSGATFNVSWTGSYTVVTGDWIFLQGIGGMTQLNNQTYVASVSGSVISLYDVYGNPVDGTSFGAWTGGGTVSRIYTLSTIYAEQDLDYLKFTQSADVMSICCVNQSTRTEYPPQDMSRISDINWVFSPATPTTTVTPPGSVSLTGTAATGTEVTTNYAYVVTSVSPVDGTESVASNPGIGSFLDISSAAGSVQVSWSAVLGVNEYNVYKATPNSTGAVPSGVQFGFAGSAYGTIWIDKNIVADFTQVPPFHKNPFARGQITGVVVTSAGSGYSSSPTVSITTTNGSGAVIIPIVNGGIVAYVIESGGQSYQPGDTVTITGGGGTGATANLVVGPESGTYPSVVAYFQQRRAYAATLNQPDTYFMSQPGAFTNFDSRIPPIASDAITGTPWSEEVNGIQFLVPVTGGLIAMTGLEAYLVTGTGGNVFSPQPLAPASQQAQPQGFNGCSPTVPPVRIYQDILYVQAKGSTYRDFAFDVSSYTYTGLDLTLNSSHLFIGQTIKQHAWCEEPYKILWAVRDDGVLLSLTYQKKEQVAGWARHDTKGLFVSVCSVTEPPVDALYLSASRPFNASKSTYTIERMDNRIWDAVENTWCVDCGVSLSNPEPPATLAAIIPATYGAVTGTSSIVGGSGYSVATTATVIDAPLTANAAAGPGSGATATLTIVGGVITAVAFPVQGAGYQNPQLVIYDPAGSEGGSGGSAVLTIDTRVQFQASSTVFSAPEVGWVIRMGGGIGTITSLASATTVNAVMTTPFSAFQANGGGVVQIAQAGSWSVTQPIQTVNGLLALAGQMVTGLADGKVITPRTVSSTGQIVLDAPASSITLGLAFQAQLQSTYLDAGEPTVQGQRKKVAAVTARVEASGQFLIGSNQPDGSTLSPTQIAPAWSNLTPALTGAVPPYQNAATPLFTGDIRIPVSGGFQRPGQVCIQQDLPLPVQVLAFFSELLEGDNPAQAAPKPDK